MAKERTQWSEAHFTHAYWFEKSVGLLAFTGGCVGAWFADGFLQYFCFIITAFGMNAVLPSSRPLFSNIVDRLPFLASKETEE